MFFDGAVEVFDEPFPDPPAVHCAAALEVDLGVGATCGVVL